jgi:hypothetical protein
MMVMLSQAQNLLLIRFGNDGISSCQSDNIVMIATAIFEVARE